MRTLLEALEEASFTRLGPRDVRRAQVYDFGSRVRNFAGDLAMRAIAKGEPEEEVASASPKVKRALRVALDALDKLAKEIFDTEMGVIDITPAVRGRLSAEGLDEALTAAGIRATLDRALEKARAFAAGELITVVRTYVAGGGPTPMRDTVCDIQLQYD